MLNFVKNCSVMVLRCFSFLFMYAIVRLVKMRLCI